LGFLDVLGGMRQSSRKAPSSKLQKNPKLQSPKSAWEARSRTLFRVGRVTRPEMLVFGAWDLELFLSLELGAWSF
jgi:hypothetical protein